LAYLTTKGRHRGTGSWLSAIVVGISLVSTRMLRLLGSSSGPLGNNAVENTLSLVDVMAIGPGYHDSKRRQTGIV